MSINEFIINILSAVEKPVLNPAWLSFIKCRSRENLFSLLLIPVTAVKSFPRQLKSVMGR